MSHSRSGAKFNWESFARDPHASDAFMTRLPWQFDLSAYDVVSHDGLACLLATTTWRRFHGRGDTFVTLPESPESLAYLTDVRFLDNYFAVGGFLTNGEVLDYNQTRIREILDRRSGKFGHVRPYSPTALQRVDEDSCDNVVDALQRFFAHDVSSLLDTTSLSEVMFESRPFQQTIRELVMNIAMHGGAETGSAAGIGFCCYRPFPIRHSILRFSCSDIGLGFRETLRLKGGLATSDVDAVLQGFLYRHLHPENGILGLFPSLAFVRQFQGRLLVRSGAAILALDLSDVARQRIFDSGYLNPSIGWLRRLTSSRAAPEVGGTHIVVDLQLPRAARFRSHAAL